MSNIKELLRKMVQEALAEAETAPTKPTTKPTVAPGKPGEKPKPRRPLGNPDVKPNPKAMNEEEMLNKIIDRFKSKNMSEALNKEVYLKKLLKANGHESLYNSIINIPTSDANKVALGMELIFNNFDCAPNGGVIDDVVEYLRQKSK